MLNDVLYRLRCLLRRSAVEAELADELQAHLEHEAEKYEGAGLPRPEALRRARIALGGLERVKEECREARGVSVLQTALRNLRYGLRSLAGRPGFTLATVLVLALGIGPTTALFTIVRSVLLKPLPFREPNRLVRLYENSGGQFTYNTVAGGVFTNWKKQSHGFSDMALLGQLGYNLSGSGGQLPEKVAAAACSWNLFPLLGIQPVLGRGFSAADDQPSAGATAILSWALWKRRFGGSASVLGQTIHLDARPYTVIGVMPAWFSYPEQAVQLWTAIYHEVPREEMQALDSHDFVAIGRLKPGASEKEATAELSLIVRRLHDQQLNNPFISKSANSRPLLNDMVGDIRTPLYVLFVATACVLLIAALNVAGLLVARGAARRKELAIRTALGGSRWRLFAEHLTESFLLCGAGGALGVLMAYGAIQWFVHTRPDMSRVETVHMDALVAGFVVGVIALCALFVGMTSSLSVNDGQILSALQESGRSHGAGQAGVGLRKGLLVVEFGLTVVLLIGAGLLLKSYVRLRSGDLGCITNNVLTMRLSLPDAKYSQPAQRVNFFASLLERVRSLPGVQAAGLVRLVPGQGYGGDNGFLIAEHPPLPLGKMQLAIRRWADPGYFAALGIPFLEGRTFDEDQRLGKTNEVVISRSLARKYFPGEDPIGKHLLTLGRRWFTIMGVVGDTRFLISQPPQPMMYFPASAGTFDNATLAVRSKRDVNQLALPIQRVVQQLDADLAVSDVMTMDQMIGQSVLDANFNATLLLAFALLSLILAAVGLFGVLSYLVAQRTTEIGIRIALGAERGEVLWLMLADGLRPAAVGLAIGLAAGVAAGETIRHLLYGVQPLDKSVFAGVTAVLLCVAAGAALLPAWRASRLDPMQALRNE